MSDICAVLNVHREGLLAHSSLLSMVRSRLLAEAAGISVEILLVADCPDLATEAYMQTAQKFGARTLVTDVDDLGLARNVAVLANNCRFMAFLDGDDMWSPRWLQAAFAAASQTQKKVVWHPEGNFYFGEHVKSHWMIHPDMDDFPEDWTTLGVANLWTSLVFAPREIFLKVPYKKHSLDLGFGYEDWAWNCDVVAHNAIHKVVRGTAHLIRRNSNSLNMRSNASMALPAPTELFRSRLNSL